MRKSRFTTEQIIGFIKQAEAGMAVSELGRQHGFSPSCPPPRGKPCARAARMKTRLSMSRQARWATSNARPSDHRRLRAARRLGLVLCRRSGSRMPDQTPQLIPRYFSASCRP